MYSWSWGMFIQENGTKDRDTVLEDKYFIMESTMRVSGRMINQMDMEDLSIKMAITMYANIN